jgi:isoamylase
MPRYEIAPGAPHPLGAVPNAEGVGFTVFSQHATSVELLMFERHDDGEPFQTIRLDPACNKTFHFWHVCVKGLPSGTHYVYRVDGPYDPSRAGHCFNSKKVLIDPYTHGNTLALWNRVDACGPGG